MNICSPKLKRSKYFFECLYLVLIDKFCARIKSCSIKLILQRRQIWSFIELLKLVDTEVHLITYFEAGLFCKEFLGASTENCFKQIGSFVNAQFGDPLWLFFLSLLYFCLVVISATRVKVLLINPVQYCEPTHFIHVKRLPRCEWD